MKYFKNIPLEAEKENAVKMFKEYLDILGLPYEGLDIEDGRLTANNPPEFSFGLTYNDRMFSVTVLFTKMGIKMEVYDLKTNDLVAETKGAGSDAKGIMDAFDAAVSLLDSQTDLKASRHSLNASQAFSSDVAIRMYEMLKEGLRDSGLKPWNKEEWLENGAPASDLKFDNLYESIYGVFPDSNEIDNFLSELFDSRKSELIAVDKFVENDMSTVDAESDIASVINAFCSVYGITRQQLDVWAVEAFTAIENMKESDL